MPSFDVDIEDHDIAVAVADDPDLIVEAMRIMAKRRGCTAAEQAMAKSVIDLLDGPSTDPEDTMEPAAWAEAYRLMDRIDRDRALDALRQLCPGELP